MRLAVVFFCLIAISIPAGLFTGCGSSGGSDETAAETSGKTSGGSVSDSFSISGEGTGTTADDNFYCSGGNVQFQYNHEGERSFTVSLVDGLTGVPIVILASGSAAFDGYNSMDLPANEYYFDITADGGWTITVTGNCWTMSELNNPSPPKIETGGSAATDTGSDTTSSDSTDSSTDDTEPITDQDQYIVGVIEVYSFELYKYQGCCNSNGGIYGCLVAVKDNWEIEYGYIVCNDGTEAVSCECPK